jgi:hypothetical protein
MVAGQEDLVTVQASGHREGVGNPAQGEVSKNEYPVVRADGRVPTLEDRFVHVIGIRERSTAIPADVGMPEMEVGGDPVLAHDGSILSAGAGPS